ncbi:MAG TPA: tRNA (adenosine(37)-N6)-threonylcarbamoyltransferase complex ATPase subunit type 1 TsaE [Candidatus Dormibacteraeota bacterium]|nr:tRNA (adenosine(37)-N6)-threonylcarbamoyltransferase complex ATPase subunit type 1 TsaE [Candidatus Dormibacteraeota bacterium]
MSAPRADLTSDSPATTERHGAALGRVLRPGDVLALNGSLGAGKTCLVRGIVAGAGGDPTAVRSPTFVLHQPHRAAGLTVHHVDLYRLGRAASLDVLDLDGLLVDGAVVIEWAEYADLTGFAAATISTISMEAGAVDEQRVLHLDEPAPGHIAAAWTAITAGLARS